MKSYNNKKNRKKTTTTTKTGEWYYIDISKERQHDIIECGYI